MRQLSRCDLLHAVADHDIEEVRSLLRQAGSQHLSLPADFYPELPEIIRWLYLYFSRPGKAPFAERYWQVLPDAEYWILTCVCCVPGCANVRAPVLSMIFGDVAHWRVTSSEDDEEPGVYYLAVPVADYLRDIDLLLAPIERGIKEAVVDDEAGPDSPIVEFSATAHSLKKVKTLRNLIRRKLSGEKIPEFKKKTGTDFHEN